MRNNTIHNSNYSFYVKGSELSDFCHDIDSTNTIDGRPIYYIVEQSDLIFDESMIIGYLALVSCLNVTVKNRIFTKNEGLLLVNTSNSNIINLNIYKNTQGGIQLYYSSNTNITNCTIHNNYYGIDIRHSNNNTINANNITSNIYTGVGILIRESSCYNIIKGNSISKLSNGISIRSSSNNTITGNNISNNKYFGIPISQGSSYNKIKDNDIISNNYDGIFLERGNNYNKISNNDINLNNRHGIHIWSSKNNIIRSNNITSNDEDGIHLRDSTDNNIIIGNIITSNKENSIYIEKKYHSSDNNTIYNNNFINNSQNAYDECNNTWDNGYPSGGNYWDDYNGTDSDGDGIGDTPYLIPGGDNKDRYPLMEPYRNHPPDIPTITGPNSGKTNIEYDFTFNSTDPDGDAIMYIIDWGDNTTEWTEYNDSGEEIILKHTWNETGVYIIRAKAIDIYGAESDWGTFEVSIPRDKYIQKSPFLNFLLSHPNLFPLIQKLVQNLGL
jgi:parallel beta-helix repeat protein